MLKININHILKCNFIQFQYRQNIDARYVCFTKAKQQTNTNSKKNNNEKEEIKIR